MDEDDSAGCFDLYGKYSVFGRIWTFSKHDCLCALFNSNRARVSPQLFAIVRRYFDLFGLVFILPKKWNSLIRFKIYAVARLNLANFKHVFRSIREYKERSYLDYPLELIQMFVIESTQIGIWRERAFGTSIFLYKIILSKCSANNSGSRIRLILHSDLKLVVSIR